MTEYIQKSAGESKVYTIDWAQKSLGTDTIPTNGGTFTFVPNGISISNVSNNSSTSTCTISGGSPGVTYTITAAITTAGSQQFQETIYCFVEP